MDVWVSSRPSKPTQHGCRKIVDMVASKRFEPKEFRARILGVCCTCVSDSSLFIFSPCGWGSRVRIPRGTQGFPQCLDLSRGGNSSGPKDFLTAGALLSWIYA